jgi:hypothetical protein
VCAMEWSSDSYVLAVGFERGWAVWSVAGRCLAWSFGYADSVDEERFRDVFMGGVRALFWAPGDFELVVLAQSCVNGASTSEQGREVTCFIGMLLQDPTASYLRFRLRRARRRRSTRQTTVNTRFCRWKIACWFTAAQTSRT